MKILYWILIAMASYSYLLYPAVLSALPRRRAPRPHVAENISRISVIIAARNEESKIAAKIENTLRLSARNVELEIIVASDASDDRTDEIVSTYQQRGVILARSPVRNGKEHAQRLAIARSSGQLLVFTDAGTTIPDGALDAIVDAFMDPDVGAISSVDQILMEDGSVQGEGLYVRYEMWLRELESRFNSLVGLSGSFFAARRSVCDPWDTRVPSDFGTALNCVRLGYRAVSNRAVIGLYRNVADPSKEYARKLRTVLRGMIGLRHRSDVLNPLKYGWFSFQVFSHKVMRWAVPWLLGFAFLINATLLADSALYRVTFAGMAMLFSSPMLVRVTGARRIPLLRVAAYFIEANVAILLATIRVLRGDTMATWEPSKRNP